MEELLLKTKKVADYIVDRFNNDVGFNGLKMLKEETSKGYLLKLNIKKFYFDVLLVADTCPRKDNFKLLFGTYSIYYLGDTLSYERYYMFVLKVFKHLLDYQTKQVKVFEYNFKELSALFEEKICVLDLSLNKGIVPKPVTAL